MKNSFIDDAPERDPREKEGDGLGTPSAEEGKTLGQIAYEGFRSVLETVRENDNWWSYEGETRKAQWEASAQAVAAHISTPYITALAEKDRMIEELKEQSHRDYLGLHECENEITRLNSLVEEARTHFQLIQRTDPMGSHLLAKNALEIIFKPKDQDAKG